MPILQSVRTISPEMPKGGGDITVVGGTALMPESGPIGTMADVEDSLSSSEIISLYIVRSGDTVGSIAKMFGVSSNTVIWANDLKGSVIREGQQLVILPISGIKHIVKKGETFAGVAKKYKADVYDITRYNDLALNDVLKEGSEIIVPDGEIASPNTSTVTTNKLRGANGPSYEGYYLKPILGGRKSQGLHGYNGVDLASYMGAPIFASAEGTVIISAHSGWNGGYGKYIVIAHPNGTQTLYGHLSENLVKAGDYVVRGQTIGLLGSTGKSTGPHLHFEIRGAKNPF
jgi:murein DD-endopeptidase MepM/ murein hydrolase activator NlpD